MIKYYIKIAYRNFIKNKLNSALSIVGFGIALTIVILISLYSYKELTTNQFHKDADRIFKVSGWSTPTALAPFLKNKIPEIEAITRVRGGGNVSLSLPDSPNNQFKCRILWSENSFFNVFTYPIIKGNAHTALEESKTIVLSKKKATALFGDTDPINKTILFNGTTFTVTGIMENPPHNSSLSFDAVISAFSDNTNDLSNNKLWKDWNVETFAKFHPIKDLQELTEKIQETIKKEGQLMYEVEHVKLYTLKEVYFNKSLFSNFIQGNEKNVMSMIWIGLIVLLLAIVNFYNLATSQAIERHKEIGIRKVNGAKRFNITYQFFLDTLLVSFLSMFLAMLIINLILPWFNNLTNAEFDFFHFTNLKSWGLLILGSILLTIISSVYPALYLSSFNPIDAIKGGKTSSNGVIVFKKVLITFQFTISILLIIAVLFISKQIKFLETKDLGFEKEHILCVYPTQAIFKSKNTFIDKLSENPAIMGVSFTNGYIGSMDSGFKLKTQCNGEERDIWSKQITVDTAFAKVFDIKFINQPSFDKTKPYVLLNNTALKKLNMPSHQGVDVLKKNSELFMPLAGVVKDFHFMSLYNGIEPLTIYVEPQLFGLINIRFNPKSYKSMSDLIAYCKKAFEEVDSNSDFNYMFLNDALAQSYNKEKSYRFMVLLFSSFAVFISCLGLFGMIVFSNSHRKKEIAIRKISGAKISTIINILLKDYLKWVGIAFLIAIPISYYVMKNWLSDFPFRTDLSWWVFFIGGFLAFCVAVITVSWQTYIAAKCNPVESLRDE